MIRLTCPAEPTHGRLMDAPGERFSFYCPHVAHDGFRDQPRTRAFFTTAEVEAGPTTPHTAAQPAQEPHNAPSGASAHYSDIDAPDPTARPLAQHEDVAPVAEPSVPASLVRVPTGAHPPAPAVPHRATGRDNTLGL